MKSKLGFKQPWINSAPTDILFILLPPFLALILVAVFPASFKTSDEMPPVYWFILVVCIDVAHVYSTLYRTYFNKDEYKKRQSLLLGIPLFCYIIGVLLYNYDGLLFWRILAYLAVFHFIRQQYGFMRLYSRNQQQSAFSSLTDTLLIYSATLYPLIFWHTHPERNFNWFIDNDFIELKMPFISNLSGYLYLTVLIIYLAKEIVQRYTQGILNIPKNLLILGTAFSWYFGIVYFDGDMAFTTLNVISHGIPYMALIWFFERKKYKPGCRNNRRILNITFGNYGIWVFVLLLALLAYAEEGLWDGLVWKEHTSLFPAFDFLPQIRENTLLSLLVPLLSLPQSTHYVLDGFIWRRENRLIKNGI